MSNKRVALATDRSAAPVNITSGVGAERLMNGLSLAVILMASWGCYSLCTSGNWLTPNLSVLHGYSGLRIGIGGVILGLVAPGRLRTCLVMAWLSIWFTAGFAELRASGVTDGTVMGGLLPYSDAYNYLRDTSRLIEGENMTSSGSRRPLADTYLATNLYAARNDLAGALVMTGILSAVAIGLAALELRKTMGLFPVILWTWLLMAYYRRYLGELMSEHVGVAFGALAVALLLRAYRGNSIRSLCCGLLVLSLALSARAGAFIVLPLLVTAAAWRWRISGKIRVLCFTTLSVAAALILNFSFVKLLGPPNGKIMSNYHNVIYGVIFGGNWQQAAADIPNYNRMDEASQAAEVYRRIGAAIRANPKLIWRGAVRNWTAFFLGSSAALGPYSFLREPSTERILFLLSGIGLLWSLAIRDRVAPIILAGGVGIVLSVPFVPTSDADLMRAYAATMPLMFLIPSFALCGWRAWIGRIASVESASIKEAAPTSCSNDSASPLLNLCAIAFLSVMLVVPLFARFVAPIEPAAVLRTIGPEIVLTLDCNRSTWIELTARDDTRRPNPHRILAERFKNNIFGMFQDFYPKQAEFLKSIARPGVVLVSPDSTNAAFVVIDAKVFHGNDREITIEGRANLADNNYSPSFLANGLIAPTTEAWSQH